MFSVSTKADTLNIVRIPVSAGCNFLRLAIPIYSHWDKSFNNKLGTNYLNRNCKSATKNRLNLQ